MKILQAPENKWKELSDSLIVVCQYTTKQGETVFGIDMVYKPQYPDFIEVEVLDPNAIWHEEDKAIQLVQTQEGFNWAALNMDELVTYRKTNNIITHQYNSQFYYYINTLLPEHKTLFENESRLEIIIIEKH